MPVKKYKPTTSGRRFASVLTREEITKQKPEKSLVTYKISKAGRNNQGRITVRHRGAGAKRAYRLVDFKQNRYEEVATVLAIEYDPNRTANIALIEYPDKTKSYILAPSGLTVGMTVVSSKKPVEITAANRTCLKNIPIGLMVYAIETQPGRGAVMVRSAGLAATLMSRDQGQALLKLPSGEMRLVSEECSASLGTVGNEDWRNVRLGKAGRMRHRGVRPRVRGKVMNPVDHPHGGGEGKHPVGMKHPKTPWGKPALGVKTRRANKKTNDWIVRRRPRKDDK